MDTESSPFSSPFLIIFDESHHLFNPGMNLSCFPFLSWFRQVLLDVAMVLLWISPFWLRINFVMRISVRKPKFEIAFGIWLLSSHLSFRTGSYRRPAQFSWGDYGVCVGEGMVFTVNEPERRAVKSSVTANVLSSQLLVYSFLCSTIQLSVPL